MTQIEKAKSQVESGHIVTKSLEELEKMSGE